MHVFEEKLISVNKVVPLIIDQNRRISELVCEG